MPPKEEEQGSNGRAPWLHSAGLFFPRAGCVLFIFLFLFSELSQFPRLYIGPFAVRCPSNDSEAHKTKQEQRRSYLANCGINGQAALPDGGWSSHHLKVRFSRNELAGAAWTVSLPEPKH
ncbi:hypothetical protein E2320_012004 [Naja naja]|nr:hypothetical protein E2320_012004 [Naja naja]